MTGRKQVRFPNFLLSELKGQSIYDCLIFSNLKSLYHRNISSKFAMMIFSGYRKKMLSAITSFRSRHVLYLLFSPISFLIKLTVRSRSGYPECIFQLCCCTRSFFFYNFRHLLFTLELKELC